MVTGNCHAICSQKAHSGLASPKPYRQCHCSHFTDQNGTQRGKAAPQSQPASFPIPCPWHPRRRCQLVGLGKVCSLRLGVLALVLTQCVTPDRSPHCPGSPFPQCYPLLPFSLAHWPVLRGDGPPQEERIVVHAITDMRWRKGPVAGGIRGPQLPGPPLVAMSQHCWR